VLVNRPIWSTLARTGLNTADGECNLERGLLAAVALSHAGCHPVVVMNFDLLLAKADLVRRVVYQARFRGTLILLGCKRPNAALWGAEALLRHELAPDYSAADVAGVLAACLTGPPGTALCLTHEQIVTVELMPCGEVPTAEGRHLAGPESGIPFAVSAQSAQSDQQEIARKRLRLEALRWVQDYDRVGRRNLYLWRWCLHGIELTTFPDVGDAFRSHLHDTKLLSVILCVLFDDVADRHGRTELLESLIRSASHPEQDADLVTDHEDGEYLNVTGRLWAEYEARVRKYSQYPVFERLWRFDLLQFLNTMRYAHLVNSQPGLLNLTEHDIYTPHNMLMVSFSTLDLMCVPHFRTPELGSLREAMWHAQAMGRIGNVLSTWRRELSESDHSSGMFVGDMSLSMRDRERLLLEKWRWHRTRCHAAAEQVRSLDLIPVLQGHDRFFDMHLASAGRI